jgi:hypothetical protein
MSELILINNLQKLKDNPELYNDAFLEELTDLRQQAIAYETSKEKGLQAKKREIRQKIRELSDQTYIYRDTNLFGEMISTMADRILTRPQFSGYTFKEDMKSLGIEYVLKYSNNFDPYKTSKLSGQAVSAFAYISTIIFNGILQVINSFNKEQKKMKAQITEHQKLIYSDPTESTIIPEFEDIKHKDVELYNVQKDELLKEMKKYTIHEPIRFIIPLDYIITEKDYNYIIKYPIAIKRRGFV